MNEYNISSENFGDSDKLVSVTDTREIPDYYQQHINDLHKTIDELKSTAKKDYKKYERTIGRLRFRLSLLSSFWFVTVLVLCSVFGWFGSRWYSQLQLEKQLATFSPEKVQEIEKIRNDIKELSQTVIPQLQAEIKGNQEQVNKLDAKIDKSQQSMSVLVKAMQELVNSPITDKPAEENESQEDKPVSLSP
ncbi:MAG: hypothetical protein KI793_00380 [Rivularia sp. (in: Bacteria)]|nr:hypothetical protein [Rivularia sp. MS3]